MFQTFESCFKFNQTQGMCFTGASFTGLCVWFFIFVLRQTFYTLTFILGEIFYQIAWLKLPAYQAICQSHFPRSNAANQQEVGGACRCNQLDILHNDASYFTHEPDATNPCHLADPLKDFGEPIWPAALLALGKNIDEESAPSAKPRAVSFHCFVGASCSWHTGCIFSPTAVSTKPIWYINRM